MSTRNAGLDLARALAILLVLADHLAGPLAPQSLPWALGFGWVGSAGVYLFFALSGFLIGRMLLDLAEGGMEPRAMLDFWLRRWLRTLPLYYLMLWLAVSLTGVENWRSWFFLQNFRFDLPLPLPVSWSLVMEEFFYLFYPLLLWATLRAAPRLGGRRAVLAVCVALIVVCNAARVVVAHWSVPLPWPTMNPLLRLDCCAYGVLAAWAMRACPAAAARLRRFAPWLLPLAIGLVLAQGAMTVALPLPGVASWLHFGRWSDVWFTVEACWVIAGCAVIVPILAVRLPSLPAGPRLLAGWLSRISYALYLVHTIVMVWVSQHPLGPIRGALAALAISLVAATMLHVTIEQPILALRDRYVPGRRAIVA